MDGFFRGVKLEHMHQAQTPETFVSADEAAGRLGVPVAWLKAEAKAGRLPHICVSRRLLFNVPTIERVLLERAGVAMEVGQG
jgi:hypothetical protein